mmetsp:Transcript_58936/g.133437  ORF Transcript_58936/g.133437 Transcript_58936/m.133437 type:complete len:214 (+) Transcript_58936:1319-1960(+)
MQPPSQLAVRESERHPCSWWRRKQAGRASGSPSQRRPVGRTRRRRGARSLAGPAPSSLPSRRRSGVVGRGRHIHPKFRPPAPLAGWPLPGAAFETRRARPASWPSPRIFSRWGQPLTGTASGSCSQRTSSTARPRGPKPSKARRFIISIPIKANRAPPWKVLTSPPPSYIYWFDAAMSKHSMEFNLSAWVKSDVDPPITAGTKSATQCNQEAF